MLAFPSRRYRRSILVLFDHSVPAPLSSYLTDHTVTEARGRKIPILVLSKPQWLVVWLHVEKIAAVWRAIDLENAGRRPAPSSA